MPQDLQKYPTMIPVVAIALIDTSRRVLMQRRRADRAHGGLWEFPGGKVEPGETADAALLRECEEELGLRIEAGSLQPLTFAALPGERVVLMLYTCRDWAGEAACLDADELGWFSGDALESLAMPPLDVPLARVVKEVLEKTN